jgi:hypothetical protein
LRQIPIKVRQDFDELWQDMHTEKAQIFRNVEDDCSKMAFICWKLLGKISCDILQRVDIHQMQISGGK